MLPKLFMVAFLLLVQHGAFAQSDSVDMADAMRSNGKIYVVLAVVITIFAGLIAYLIRLDNKISKLEKTSHS